MSEATKIPEAPKKEAAKPVDKHPELTKLKNTLQEERKALLSKSSSLRSQKEELTKKVQPLEDKLREINEAIAAIEQPRLAEIDTQLGKLAVATGGKSLQVE